MGVSNSEISKEQKNIDKPNIIINEVIPDKNVKPITKEELEELYSYESAIFL